MNNPYSQPMENYVYEKPAVFSPVELEHPTDSVALLKYRVAKVTSDVWINTAAITWQGTPWTPCSKACGTGSQNRTVFCAMKTSQETTTLTSKIDDSLCKSLVRPPTTQFCNSFHCNLECRVNEGARQVCDLYERDTRRNAADHRTRQQACEQVGCCFVPELNHSNRRSGTPGRQECYRKPFRRYAQWLEMLFSQCSASGVDVENHTAYKRPFKVTATTTIFLLVRSIGPSPFSRSLWP